MLGLHYRRLYQIRRAGVLSLDLLYEIAFLHIYEVFQMLTFLKTSLRHTFLSWLLTYRRLIHFFVIVSVYVFSFFCCFFPLGLLLCTYVLFLVIGALQMSQRWWWRLGPLVILVMSPFGPLRYLLSPNWANCLHALCDILFDAVIFACMMANYVMTSGTSS